MKINKDGQNLSFSSPTFVRFMKRNKNLFSGDVRQLVAPPSTTHSAFCFVCDAVDEAHSVLFPKTSLYIYASP